MSVQQIRSYLDDMGAKYVQISHAPACTAQEVAASAHIPGRDMVKVVAVRIDGRMALAAVPATCDVDVNALRRASNAQQVEVASKWELAGAFPSCAVGAMPPIGQPFGVEVYMDRELARENYIAFNAGSHCDVIAMRFNDYRRVVHPKLAHISAPCREDSLLMSQI